MLTLTCPHCHETDVVEPISITGYVICGNCDNEFDIDLVAELADQDDAILESEPQLEVWESDVSLDIFNTA